MGLGDGILWVRVGWCVMITPPVLYMILRILRQFCGGNVMLSKKNYTHMYNNVYINVCNIYNIYFLHIIQIYVHIYIYILYKLEPGL